MTSRRDRKSANVFPTKEICTVLLPRRFTHHAALAVGLALIVAGFYPAAAMAITPEAGWTINTLPAPTNFSTAQNSRCISQSQQSEPHSCDAYVIVAKNAGALPTDGSTVTLEDTLPTGVSVRNVVFDWYGNPANVQNLANFCTMIPTVRCQLPASYFVEVGGSVAPDDALEMTVNVTVDEPAVPGPLANVATVSGGGAVEATTSTESQLTETLAPLGLSGLSSVVAGYAGAPDTQAGSHPYELNTTIDLNNVFVHESPDTSGEISITPEDIRDVAVDLPPGLVGSALAAPTCTLAQLTSPTRCPPETQIGHLVTRPRVIASVNSPLWNLAPEHGVVAEFGFVDLLHTSHVIYASLVPTPAGYVLRATSPELPQISLRNIVAEFYGDPATRDGSSEEPVPFFTNAADCNGEPLRTTVHIDSWLHPGGYNPDGTIDVSDPRWASTTSDSSPVSGCNQLQFRPTIKALPETTRADSPTGLEFDLQVPQSKGTETLATPPLKKAVVTLPAGMTVNPSAANGLAGCSLAQIGVSVSGLPDAAPPRCPDASKIGTVELETPSLPGVLEGQIYIAKQGENPFGSLLSFYIVVNDPKTGLIVKLPAEIKADPSTGQLTTIVDNNPQLPFSDLKLHKSLLKTGDRERPAQALRE